MDTLNNNENKDSGNSTNDNNKSSSINHPASLGTSCDFGNLHVDDCKWVNLNECFFVFAFFHVFMMSKLRLIIQQKYLPCGFCIYIEWDFSKHCFY